MRSASLAIGVFFLLIIGGALQASEAGGVPEFLDEDVTTDETSGSVTLRVGRDSTAGLFTVHYRTRDAEARAGSDYQQTAGQLVFPDGDAGPKAIQVPILNDPHQEEEESFFVILSDGSGRSMGATDVEIISDERPPPSGDSEAGPGQAGGQVGTNPASAREGKGAGADEATPSGPGVTGGIPRSGQQSSADNLIILQGPGESADRSRGDSGTPSSRGLNQASGRQDVPAARGLNRALTLGSLAGLVLCSVGLGLLLRSRRRLGSRPYQ